MDRRYPNLCLEAEMMMAGRCDSFDEAYLRGAIKMVPMGERFTWLGEELNEWLRPKPRVIANPFLARVDFTCPSCKQRAWVVGRGKSAHEARESCLANVVAHRMQCQADDDDR